MAIVDEDARGNAGRQTWLEDQTWSSRLTDRPTDWRPGSPITQSPITIGHQRRSTDNIINDKTGCDNDVNKKKWRFRGKRVTPSLFYSRVDGPRCSVLLRLRPPLLTGYSLTAIYTPEKQTGTNNPRKIHGTHHTFITITCCYVCETVVSRLGGRLFLRLAGFWPKVTDIVVIDGKRYCGSSMWQTGASKRRDLLRQP